MALTPQDASKQAREICALAPIVPVLVVHDVAHARPLAEALVAGGLPALEVTLRTPAALDVIREMAQIEGGVVGAGTLVTPADVTAAVAAGAKFGVSPVPRRCCWTPHWPPICRCCRVLPPHPKPWRCWNWAMTC